MSLLHKPDKLTDFATDPQYQLTLIPDGFWRHVLFLPTWTDFETDPVKGEEFRHMSVSARKKYMEDFKAVEMPASKDIPWVWTGQFPAPRFLPMYNGKSVTRLLYKHFVSPSMPETRRLKPMVRDLTNVNPWKYHCACGQSYFPKEQKVSPPMSKIIVAELTREIRDDWGTDDLEYVREKLKDQYPAHILDEAIRNLS